MNPRSVGFPMTRHEAAEVREFLPPLFAFLSQFPLERVVVEHGYGERMGIPPGDYAGAAPRLVRGSRDEAFAQDLVILLRCPPLQELERLRRGSMLLAMLHFPTRPDRVALMERLGVVGVAMDQVIDDLGRRLIENLASVGFNGVRVGMKALAARWPSFASPTRGPLRVTVLGAGAVGAHAVRAAVRYGDDLLRAELGAAKVPGVAVTVLDFELTGDAAFLEATLRGTDVLIDATQRKDTSVPVVQNRQLAHLPPHAVIIDLSVDPYDFSRSPPSVKGVEGVPQGFTPDDPRWTDTIPEGVAHGARRTVVSCYSWPGMHPRECMEHYGRQLEPLLGRLLERGGGARLSESGDAIDRALWRAGLGPFDRAPEP